MINWTELIGKTIKSISRRGIEGCDDIPYFDIEFTDNTKYTFEADYGGYTGDSQDEYPRFIYLKRREVKKND